MALQVEYLVGEYTKICQCQACKEGASLCFLFCAKKAAIKAGREEPFCGQSGFHQLAFDPDPRSQSWLATEDIDLTKNLLKQNN